MNFFFKYDVVDEVTQQEYSNIKFYVSAFRAFRYRS